MAAENHAGGETERQSVWVTRALPAALVTARRVESLGFRALIAPLLEIRSLGQGAIDLHGVGALAFTSANGVRAFAARSLLRDLPVFTVGDATAQVARSEGFIQVASAQGDVAALAALIGDAEPRPPGLVLHAGAAEPAGDLVGVLGAVGIPARRLDLYQANELAPDMAAWAAAQVALLHSPRAANVLARALRHRPSPTLRLICLSPAVGAPFANLALGDLRGDLCIAEKPEEDSLLALLALKAWAA